jgi:hypothetical protein
MTTEENHKNTQAEPETIEVTRMREQLIAMGIVGDTVVAYVNGYLVRIGGTYISRFENGDWKFYCYM